MIFDALGKINKNIESFDKIVIIGNSDDDAGTAKNMNVPFIDINNKSYEELKNEFNNIK